MRQQTITINIYKFDELTDRAKDKAMESLQPDWDWWDYIVHDLELIGAKLVSFELYRSCELSFNEYHTAKLILEQHGAVCDTYQAAKTYLDTYEQDEDTANNEFKQELQECYRIMLEKEYEYLCSEEYIQEHCEINEYEFNEKGELI